MINWGDIVMYLVYGTSLYTTEQFKCFKSLESYNQFVCGWVQKPQVYNLQDSQLCILSSRVMHSQRLSEKPLKPWVIASMAGTIRSAHCDCMAGLAETCTHVGALLFAVEYINRQREQKTVTQEKAYWLVPSLKKADFREVRQIDFTSSRSKKAKLDKLLEGEAPPHLELKPTRNIPASTSQEMSTFFTDISKSSSKPAILSVITPHNQQFIPRATDLELPTPLSKLYDVKLQGNSYGEVIAECEKVMSSIKVTEKQASRVEELTRDQGNSKLWYSFRAGRITASKLKAACHSDPRMPSKSLINNICYPEKVKFSTKATEYGLTNENEVLCKYKDNMEQSHSDFIICKSGFVIHPEVPYLGASPDSIVSCSCCGHGCVEVKCPYSKTNMTIQDAIISDSGFCLEISDTGHPKLKMTHAYYYQAQSQIYCTSTDYCDFVVWTGKDLHWERILPDHDFVEVCMQRAHSFTLLAVLPELLARFYSSPATTAVSALNGNTMCYCHSSRDTATDTEVMTCSYKKCPYCIFHKKCLRFTSLNLTEHQQKLKNWYCHHCFPLGVSKCVNEE